MTTNSYGFTCEKMIRKLLPEIGIPPEYGRNGHRNWFRWADKFEDCKLGVDCWITCEDNSEVAVDFTVISERETKRLAEKIARARKRGVVLISLEQGMLVRAAEGHRRALEEFKQEIYLQIPLKLKQLNGRRMTREVVSQLSTFKLQGVRI